MNLSEMKSRLPPLYAYNIEGQALAVRTAQEKNELEYYQKYSNYFNAIEKCNEADCDWYVFPDRMVLYANDCDEKLMQEFIRRRGRQLNVIQTPPKPDVFWGKNLYAVAAVLLPDGRVLYKSPEFNLEAYLEAYKEKLAKI